MAHKGTPWSAVFHSFFFPKHKSCCLQCLLHYSLLKCQLLAIFPCAFDKIHNFIGKFFKQFEDWDCVAWEPRWNGPWDADEVAMSKLNSQLFLNWRFNRSRIRFVSRKTDNFASSRSGTISLWIWFNLSVSSFQCSESHNILFHQALDCNIRFFFEICLLVENVKRISEISTNWSSNLVNLTAVWGVLILEDFPQTKELPSFRDACASLMKTSSLI